MTKQAALYGQSKNHIAMLNSSVGIHRAMQSDYKKMVTAASQDGIDIAIVSGFRDFDRQLSIWNRKVSGQLPVYDKEQNKVDLSTLTEKQALYAILLYSALPGTSRHHWGTDIDVYSPSALKTGQTLQLQAWEYEPEGPFSDLHNWLLSHAKTFGFYHPYDLYRGGVSAEPWHLSYHPIAQQYQAQFDATTLRKMLSNYPIGLKHEIIKNIDHIIEQYVMNIGEY